MRLPTISLHFARNQMTPCVVNVHGNHYTSTYFILSRRSGRLISLFGASILEKKEHLSHVQHAHSILKLGVHVPLAFQIGGTSQFLGVHT